MLIQHDDRLLRAAYAPARAIEPSEAEVAEAIARTRAPSARRGSPVTLTWKRLTRPALATLILLVGLYAAPTTRAAIEDTAEDVASLFDKWTGSDADTAPGRDLRSGEQAPEYFRDERWAEQHVKDPRVIAAAGGYKLYAFREQDGSIGFDLGDTGVGMGGLRASDFDDRSLYVLGPGSMQGPDEQGHIPWFGIAARAVTRIELTYDSGPSLRVGGIDGGFVLLVEPSRGPQDVIAFDAAGEIVGRKSIAFAY